MHGAVLCQIHYLLRLPVDQSGEPALIDRFGLSGVTDDEFACHLLIAFRVVSHFPAD